jgi:alanine racemase
VDTSKLNTWVEVSEPAYAHNLAFFRKRLSPGAELSAVVKANGYGHGMLEIAELARRHGADSFCVHSLDEALELRNAGFTQDVLVMGHVPLERLKEAVESDLRLAVFSRETLVELDRLNQRGSKPVRVHLKLETGTYRQGIDESQLGGFLDLLAGTERLKLEAAYFHFANIEDTTNHDYAFYQLAEFDRLTGLIRRRGHADLKRHAACSAATLLFPETHLDMVRLGVSQYGLWPSRETFVSHKIKHTRNGEDVLRPVLSWKTRVGQLKNVPPEASIGYGRSFQTTRASRIAVLPVGYSDGYGRGLSNQGHVLIQGRRAPVRGRVCMNIFMVDVTDIPDVALEDEVVLLGRQGDQEVSADQLAALTSTINYELVSRINPRIPRLIVK